MSGYYVAVAQVAEQPTPDCRLKHTLNFFQKQLFRLVGFESRKK